jgi:hypothetical protein
MGLVDRWQNEAVLVDPIKLGKLPQTKLASVVRLYLVNNELCEKGEGRLYRSVMCGLRYYVVPCLTDWQRHPVHAGNGDHDVVERGSQIMDASPTISGMLGGNSAMRTILTRCWPGSKSSSITGLAKSDSKRARYSLKSLRMWCLAHSAFDLASLKV